MVLNIPNTPKAIPEYEPIRKIGEGGSRIVVEAKRKSCTENVAVKIFLTENFHPRIEDQLTRHSRLEIFCNEVDLLRKLQHPNVIKYFDHGSVETTFFIEEEYMDGGNLASRLNNMSEHQALSTFLQILDGVHYMHGQGYVLRDWKLNNTLSSKDLKHVKLDDLEMATEIGKIMKQEGQTTYTHGSQKYKAPELETCPATIQTDIYALGCGLLYLLTKQEGSMEGMSKLTEKTYNKKLEKQLKAIDRKYMRALRTALAYKPENRYKTVLKFKQELIDEIPEALPTLCAIANDKKFIETIDVQGRKDSNVRPLDETDIPKLVEFYKEALQSFDYFNRYKSFAIDNQFSADYIKSMHQLYSNAGWGYLVCGLENQINSALLIRGQRAYPDYSHVELMIENFTVRKGEESEKRGTELLQEVESKIKSYLQKNNLLSATVRTNLEGSQIEMNQLLRKNNYCETGIEGNAIGACTIRYIHEFFASREAEQFQARRWGGCGPGCE